jgi:hypothetical protein
MGSPQHEPPAILPAAPASAGGDNSTAVELDLRRPIVVTPVTADAIPFAANTVIIPDRSPAIFAQSSSTRVR